MKSPAKFWGLAILVVVLVIGLGGWALHLHAKSSLARVKARLIAAGEKLSVEENLAPLVPSSDNGAGDFLDAKAMLSDLDNTLYLSAMSMLAPGRARCVWMETNAPTVQTPNIWPDLREHMRTNRPALLKLRAALERPRLQFNVSYGSGFSGLMLTHLGPLKSAAQRLSAAVMLEMRDGNLDEALLDLRALVAIPERCRDEPLMISELVRVAILAIAAGTTWEALQHPGWNDAALAGMQGWWEAVPSNGAAAGAMSMERALLIGEFARLRLDSSQIRTLGLWPGAAPTGTVADDLAEVGQKVVESPIEGFELFVELFPRQWAWGPWNSYYDEAWVLDVLAKALQAARDWQTGAPFTEVEAKLQQSTREIGEAPPQYLLSASGIADAYEKFLQKEAFAETQRRLVITAIALRRHQLKHGSWPTRLEDLDRFSEVISGGSSWRRFWRGR